MDQSLDLEFHSDVPGLGVEELRAETEEWLGDLARDHTDIIGASVALELVADAATPHTFQARVVAYMRPSNLAATEKADTPEGALKGALGALERQVRERRDELGKRWQRPS